VRCSGPCLHPGKLKLRWRVVLSAVAYLGIILFARHTLSFLTALLAVLGRRGRHLRARYRVVARHMKRQPTSTGRSGNTAESVQGSGRADERRTAHLADHQDGNVVVYSGYYPFKGSGVDMARWSGRSPSP